MLFLWQVWDAHFACHDSGDVKDQLVTVTQICGSTGAFAAILEDGRVVTWGRACDGGDSSGWGLILQPFFLLTMPCVLNMF